MNYQTEPAVKKLLLAVVFVGLLACSTPPRSTDKPVVVQRRGLESEVLSAAHARPVPVNQELTITTAHSDPDGVREVRFYVDENLVS
ncbi:MAG: hypothetical protein ACE5G8_05850, partial [Anaerolineae bacterium]